LKRSWMVFSVVDMVGFVLEIRNWKLNAFCRGYGG
jgi:hypothetical protein